MGDAHDEGYRTDGEVPVHDVELDAFSVDVTAVTNAAFAAFVETTGYVSDAERAGISAVFHGYATAPGESLPPKPRGGSRYPGRRGDNPRDPAAT